jgi:hypothetical protein
MAAGNARFPWGEGGWGALTGVLIFAADRPVPTAGPGTEVNVTSEEGQGVVRWISSRACA